MYAQLSAVHIPSDFSGSMSESQNDGTALLTAIGIAELLVRMLAARCLRAAPAMRTRPAAMAMHSRTFGEPPPPPPLPPPVFFLVCSVVRPVREVLGV